jgi:hypothetical protein
MLANTRQTVGADNAAIGEASTPPTVSAFNVERMAERDGDSAAEARADDVRQHARATIANRI